MEPQKIRFFEKPPTWWIILVLFLISACSYMLPMGTGVVAQKVIESDCNPLKELVPPILLAEL